jgi:hypothetical protein
MNRRIASVSSCALGALLVSASAASGEFLFGIEYSGQTDLFDVNQSNGSLTSIGATGRDDLGDLTSDPRDASFRVWANRIGSNELVRLNPLTGAEVSAVAMDSEDPIVSLAFDTVTGKLYGNSSVGYGAGFEALYEIDPDTGATTFIGRILFDNVYALAFDQAGTLFGVSDATNELITISTASGNGALVAPIQLPEVFDIASRPSDGTMFLADSSSDRLWTLDTGNGNVFDVGAFAADPTNVVGLAFGPVPAPGVIGVGVLAAAGVARRRSRA